MAMLSSCTLLSRAPVPAPGPKFSPAAATATLQLRKQLPPSVVALRWASSKESRRAPDLFVCQCHAKKYEYDIQPSAGEDWNVMGDEDLVILKFRVGELPKNKVEVSKTKDETHLVIRYTGDTNDDTQASKLNVQLAIPPGYDVNKDKVQPWWFDGWLVILIAKPKHDPKPMDIK